MLNCLPKSPQPGARAALAEIYSAEDREHAVKAVKAFEADDGVKWPKAAAKITEHVDVLLEFFNYPAEHWIHLRTTNPIESTFATVRLRQRVTKGPGSRAAGVAMAFKLMDPRRPAGGWSTPRTRLRSCEPAPPSTRASSSNAPPSAELGGEQLVA